MNSPLPLCALAALIASTAAAQTVDVPVLLGTGDVLPDGAVIEDIDDVAVSGSGDWLALVVTDLGGFEEDGALLLNGQVLLREGTTLPSGEVVGQILGADLGSDGVAAWSHRLDPGVSGADEALYVDGIEVVRSGATLTGPGIPGGAVLGEVRDLRYESGRLLLIGTLSIGTGDFQVLLEVGVSGTSPAYRLLAREDETPAALSGPITTITPQFDLAEDGSFAAVVFHLGASGSTQKSVLTQQGWRARQDTPGPVAGTTWAHTGRVEVAAATGGGVLISSDLETGTGSTPGVVLGPSGVLAYEGDAFGPLPGESTYFFAGAPVDVGLGGETAWIAPVEVFDDVLVLDDAALLRESTTTFGGEPVANAIANARYRSLAVADGGDQVFMISLTASGQRALALHELALGTPDGGCMAVPNSAGTVGRTRGFGSSVASANDLTIECSQLPPQQFSLLIAASGSGFIPGAGGSAGNLCLGGIFGRLNDTLAPTDMAGTIASSVDLTRIPQGVTTVAVQPGETWYFQRWHRDVVGGAQTSNFTASLGITFR
ncbi:MAG: hypothetical protein AAFU73_23680 [Planctomycetota bacterium]